MVGKLLRAFLKRLPQEGFWHTFFEAGQWVWEHPRWSSVCWWCGMNVFGWLASISWWTWIAHGTAVALIVTLLFIPPPGVTGDGYLVAERMRRVKSWRRAEKIYARFMRQDQDLQHFPEQVVLALWLVLPDNRRRALLNRHPDIRLHHVHDDYLIWKMSLDD